MLAQVVDLQEFRRKREERVATGTHRSPVLSRGPWMPMCWVWVVWPT